MKRTQLRRQSDKAKSRVQERRECVARVRRRDHNRCRGRDAWPEIRCWGDLQPHELILRKHWPDGIFHDANVLMLCEAHHRAAHDNPDEAHARGLRKWSHERKDIDGTR